MMDESLKQFEQVRFQEDLINWYNKERRTLPWRMNQDPYRIWVSEIMLQQTRVDTVIPYFENFMKLFPTVEALAKANSQDVLKAWEGLGYYSRARNLQAAAKQVVELYDGVIPAQTKLLGNLKGIGLYTKGAIMSIAFDKPEPAVDGNVMRVLARILNIDADIKQPKTRKIFEEIVREIISKTNPSAFNQGLMELGAMVCTPKQPMCLLCPVQSHCVAFAEGKVQELPVRSKAKKKKVEQHAVLLIYNNEGKILIEHRHKKGLLQNLWQYPMFETKSQQLAALEEQFTEHYQIPVEITEKVGNLKHVFTHIIWELTVYTAHTHLKQLPADYMKFIHESELNDFPFPVSHQNITKAHLRKK